jgi:V8-like Glu-specific endopeptidase
MAQLVWLGWSAAGWPWLPICTATIIHERFVLTASHCLEASYPNESTFIFPPRTDQWEETETGNYTVVAGTVELATEGKKLVGAVRRVSKRIIPHPK